MNDDAPPTAAGAHLGSREPWSPGTQEAGDRPAELEPPVDSIPASFGRGTADANLARRARWAGAALILFPLLLPAEQAWARPLFLWEILGELPPAGLVAALSPALSGVVILLLALLVKRATSLAVGIVTTLAVNALLIKIGASAAAWDVLALPDGLTARFSSALLAEALAGAAVTLAYRRETRAPARWVAGLGGACALWFYAVPVRDEFPITTIARVFISLPFLPDLRFVIGHVLIGSIALIPLVAVVLGAAVAAFPPPREPRVLAPLVTFAMPAALLALAFRHLLSSFGDLELVSNLCATFILLALLALLSGATVVLADALAPSLSARRRRVAASGGERPLLRPALLAVAVALPIVAVEAWLARPIPKGVTYELTAASPLATRVFGRELPAWDEVRSGWADRRRRDQSSTMAVVELQQNGRALLESARDLDPPVERALRELVQRSRRLDLAGRRWFRLVEDLNLSLRAAKLPYYVDPRVALLPTEAGLETRFQLVAYQVEAVRPASARGQRFAVLHVSRLGGASDREGRLLGLSRDAQPFALVDLGVVEDQVDEFERARREDCSEPQPGSVGFEGCQLLVAFGPKGELAELVVRTTERHELEHQIDGPHLAVASAVLRRLPGVYERDQDRVNRELSAYLAEMTTSNGTPRLQLLGFALMLRRSPTSTLYQVSVLALEALLERSLAEPLAPVAEEPAARALAELRGLDDVELRRRAARAWRRLYRRALPEVELGPLARRPGGTSEIPAPP